MLVDRPDWDATTGAGRATDWRPILRPAVRVMGAEVTSRNRAGLVLAA
jgi:hypothetical protein